MAIRMMTSKERFEAGVPNIEKVSDYPGHEEGMIRHCEVCPHFSPGKSSEIRPEGLYEDCPKWVPGGPYMRHTCYGPFGALYMETSRIGLVLDASGEYNGRDDSDFYAVCWNWEKNAPEQVEFASTRGWTYPNSAAVDATPEVLAAYAEYGKRLQKEALERCEAERAAALAKEAKTPRRGKYVVVKRGRKVPLGFEGWVIWEGIDSYGKPRIGVKNSTGKVEFTAASNCEVCSPPKAPEALERREGRSGF
jgi:hypothetical protein